MSCGSSARLIAAHRGERGRAVLGQRGISSCPARRRARRCRCRPWPAPARPGARTAPWPRLTSSASAMSTSSVEMEVAVADMADDRRHQAALGDVALGLGDAFGQPRDRHADVGRHRLRAGPQRRARPVGVVARLPEPGAVLGLGRPLERAAAEIRARSRRSAPTARRRRPAMPWNSTNSIGTSGSVELGIEIGRLHLQLVEQFDARHRDAGLDGRDGGVAGGLDRRETGRRRRRSPPECRAASA